MDASLQTLMMLARTTLTSPRAGARLVMEANVPLAARWIALVVMAILSAVLAHVSFSLLPQEVQAQMGTAMASPFRTTLMQGALMLIAAHAIVWIGRWRGGHGSFADVLILMVWLQFILLTLQVAQIAAQVLIPSMTQGLGFLSVGLFIWLLSNFVAEVHGFKSVGMTFFGVMLALLGMGFLLALIMLPFMETAVR